MPSQTQDTRSPSRKRRRWLAPQVRYPMRASVRTLAPDTISLGGRERRASSSLFLVVRARSLSE